MTELLPCPFCGGPAEMREDPPKYSHDAWTFIRCKHNCSASPHVGRASAVGYYKGGTLDFVRTKTDEEAQRSATEYAVEDWNRRASAPGFEFYVNMQKRGDGMVYADLHKTDGHIYLTQEEAQAAIDADPELKPYRHVVRLVAVLPEELL